MSSERILSQILGSGAASGFAGGLASGMLTSKAGRKLGKNALAAGGLAALGGLAFAAWSRRNASAAAAGGRHPEATPSLERFVPPPERPRVAEALSYVLLQAMVAAAHADGRLDPKEFGAIRTKIDSLDLTAGERALLLEQIECPVSVAELVAAAQTPEQACEIYAASAVAIDLDTPAERAYLDMLAARLGLTPELVDAIHIEAGALPADAEADSLHRAAS